MVRTPEPEDLPFMKNASVTSDGRVQKEEPVYPKGRKGLLFSTGFCVRGGGRKRYFFCGCFARGVIAARLVALHSCLY